MAHRLLNGKYVCSYCGKEFASYQEADSCRDSHELIYVPFTLKELDSLIKYIYLRSESVLDPKVVERLQKFKKKAMLESFGKEPRL